ncbi:Uncharacterized protein DBV15_00596 [Temnothorax longispinosus]|uniref:Uncharacterized protein n=1 Tax=Temnothorax longispinosus TaxID=300112 RepID=A0A4S2KT53_9HYME|nr:Uncharacterized protein DBV15_00596 [Temnothorax longispinosus]
MQTSEASLDSRKVQNRNTPPVCRVCARDVYGTVTSCRRHYDRWASISIDLSGHTHKLLTVILYTGLYIRGVIALLMRFLFRSKAHLASSRCNQDIKGLDWDWLDLRIISRRPRTTPSEAELSTLNIRSVGLRRRFRFMLEDTWDGHPYGGDLSGQMKATSKDGYGTDVTSLSAFLRRTLSAL